MSVHDRFDLQHYVELIASAKAGGYTFRTFDDRWTAGVGPQPGDLYVRHDVDFDPHAAGVMAAIESAMDVRATYLWMTSSELYSFDAPSVQSVVGEVRQIGHLAGWHPRRSDGARATRPDLEPLRPLFAWHNPGPGELGLALDGWWNCMSMPWAADAGVVTVWASGHTTPPVRPVGPSLRQSMPPGGGRYRSDSNQHWRAGSCPCHELRSGQVEWMHLLVHPEVWVYPGASMRETMLTMLDVDARRRQAQVRSDKIDWSDLLPAQVTGKPQVKTLAGLGVPPDRLV